MHEADIARNAWTVLQPVRAKSDNEVKEIGTQLVNLLTQVGLYQVRMEFKRMRPVSSVCVLGTK
jgi:hypothetical protein